MAMTARGACPLCAGKERSLFARSMDVEMNTSDDVYQYFECGSCAAIYLDPVPADRLNLIYPDTYYSYSSRAHRSLLESIKLALDRRLLRGILKVIPGDRLSVLDVGGGDGWALDAAKKADHRVAYTCEVDLNEKAKAPAKRQGHEFFCERIEDFSPGRNFDLIVVLNLIEHVYDPAAVLQKLSGLLTPGGRILIKTPNTDTMDRRLFRRHYWGGLHCPRHWVLFNRVNFVQPAKHAGLQVDRFKYTQGAPQWAASILGTLAQNRLITLNRERPMHRHPLVNALQALFAAIDFLRKPFSPTAQMIFVLKTS